MAVTWKQLAYISDDVYDATWNGIADEAPSKNAVYDEMETKADKGVNTDITSMSAVTKVENAIGDLKLQPDVHGDIILFGDIDVGNAEDGKTLYIHRKAAEGDVYVSFGIGQYQNIKWYASKGLMIEADGHLRFQSGAAGDVEFFKDCASGENRKIIQSGYLTAAATRKYINWQVSDVTDDFELSREDSNIQNFSIKMPVIVEGNITTGGIVEAITTHNATEPIAASTMYGNTHRITGAYIETLPAAVIGMSALFRASTAAVFSVKAGISDHFEMFDGTILDAADKQTSSGSKNEFIQIYCETANTWITVGQNGTFVDGGA